MGHIIAAFPFSRRTFYQKYAVLTHDFFFVPFQNSPEQISQFTLAKASYSKGTQCLLSCMHKFADSGELLGRYSEEKLM